MAFGHHTIIFVPHERARFRKIRVSNLQITLLAAVLLLLTAGSSFVIWSYLSADIDSEDVAALRHENDQLRRVNQSFENSIQELQRRLEEYEDRTRKLAIVAGLDDLGPVDDSGIGGDDLFAEPTLDTELHQITTRVASLSSGLEEVEKELRERQRWISSAPSITPTKGLFTSGYGFRRDPLTGRRAFHQGVDISALPGTPVRASADGLVTLAAWIGHLGKAVHLSHGFGLSTRYGHLSKIAVEPGQRVKRGDLVGYVGSTGRSTGYHLHYEVRQEGKAVNPLAYILDRGR